MSVSVRVATSADAEALATVAAVTFPLACPPHTTAEAQAVFIAEVLSAERFAEYVTDPERVVLVAEDPETDGFLGYTMLIFGEPYDSDVVSAIRIRPTSELSKCYVMEGHHGKGVAGALAAASFEAARSRGAAGMWLGVNQENAKAQRFYGKQGFEKVGIKHFHVGDEVEDDFVLERAL